MENMVITKCCYIQAFKIIMDNVLRVAAINSVGAFVLFLGKIGVMAATAAVGVFWLKVRRDNSSK